MPPTKTTIEEFIAAQIMNIRLAHARSQQRLAKEAGLSEGAITRLEGGRRPARLETLEILAKAFGTPLSTLFEEMSAPPAGPARRARPRSRRGPGGSR